MKPYVGHIEKVTEKNKYFRKVLFTGKHTQLVVMCLQPKEEIGDEVHDNVDQFFRIEEGRARFVFNGKEKHVVVMVMQWLFLPERITMSSMHRRISPSSYTRCTVLQIILTEPFTKIKPKQMPLKLPNTSKITP